MGSTSNRWRGRIAKVGDGMQKGAIQISVRVVSTARANFRDRDAGIDSPAYQVGRVIVMDYSAQEARLWGARLIVAAEAAEAAAGEAPKHSLEDVLAATRASMLR